MRRTAIKKWLSVLLAALLAVSMTACGGQADPAPHISAANPVQSVTPEAEEPSVPLLDEDGSYTSAEDVGLYLHLYGELPSNFMTKSQARELGWPGGGGLEEYAPVCVSAATGSATGRSCSRMMRGEPGLNATSIPWAPMSGVQSGSCFPMTG